MNRIVMLFFFSLIPFAMFSQIQKTFLYEIKLYDQYKHQSMWTEREHRIQQEHIAYLDSLTQNGALQIAGIVTPGLEGQSGLIVLTTSSYEAAKQIVSNDPSVKMGMMSAAIRAIDIYFRKEE